MSDLLTFSPWVKLNSQKRGRVRLFCFPYAGGGSSAYATWTSAISPDIELCPVQLPGREERFSDTPFTRLDALIEEVAGALMPYIDVPFAFYGHSLGALIGFELTRCLRRKNAPLPIHLFVSGCPAPQFPVIDPPIHQLSETDFIQALRSLNGTPDAVLQNADLMRVLSPLLRADFALCETYTYRSEEPLAIPISAYGGLEDLRAPRESVEAWKVQTNNTFIMRMYSGDHFFLHTKRKVLLQGVRQDLTFV